MSKRVLLWLSVVPIAVGAGFAARLTSVAASERAQVTAGAISPTVFANAEVVPSGGVTAIRPRVDGLIKSVHVAVGDRVKAGQLLAEIDCERSNAEQHRLEAERDSRSVELSSKSKSVLIQKQRKLEFDVAAAAAQAARATTESERLAGLLPKGFATEAAVEAAKLEARAAEEKHRSLQAELSFTRDYEGPADRRSAEARLRAAEAAVEAARRNAESGRVESLIDGVILARSVNVGDVVNSSGFGGQPLFEVADVTRLEVRAELLPDDAQRVQPGQSVEIRSLGSSNSLVGTGTLRLVGPRLEKRAIGRVDPFAPLIRNAWITVTSWSPGLNSPPLGQAFEVRMPLGSIDVHAMAPRKAVRVVNGDAVIRTPWLGAISTTRRVELGISDDQHVELHGVAAGTALLTSP